MPVRLLSVISGILAGGIPGFRIELCCFFHPFTCPRCVILCFLCFASSSVAILILTHKMSSCMLFPLLVVIRRPDGSVGMSWYGVGLASADRLPVVVRIPAGPLGSLKCDPPKGNGRRPQKKLLLVAIPLLGVLFVFWFGCGCVFFLFFGFFCFWLCFFFPRDWPMSR